MKIFSVVVLLIFMLFGCSLVFAQSYQNQEKIPGYGQTNNFAEYLKQIIGFGFATIGILALFMIVIGAYQYLMAAGNIGKVDSAKETIGSAIFGLILGLCAWLILYKINPDLVSMNLSNISGTESGTMTSSTYGTIAVSGTTRERIAQYDAIIKEAAQKYPNVPEALIRAMIDQESKGVNGQTSTKGAQGLMQLMPATASMLGVTDPNDASQNIMGGTKYISQMISKYNGNIEQGLAAYNFGPGNYDLYLSSKQNLPQETQNFVSQVMGKTTYYNTRLM